MEERLSNDRIIAFHRQKEDYQHPPPNTLSFAYEDFRYQKMTIELTLADDILKIKTLQEINEDFHCADLIALALQSSDILTILIQHTSNTNSQIRELASRSMVLICAVKIGRDRVMEQKYVASIMKLFDDHVKVIRNNAYQSMLGLSQFQEGVDHILEQGVLSPLVDKLIEENEEQILVQVLNLMMSALSGELGQVEILRGPAIKRLTGLIQNGNSQIRKLAVDNLRSISFSEKGKIEVINMGVVLPLVNRLKDDDYKVIQAASMALCSLAQRNEAKFQIIDNNKLEDIIKLLNHSNEDIKLNIVQLIASMAEHPKGRQMCHSCIETLNQIINNGSDDYIAIYAKQAIAVILWVP